MPNDKRIDYLEFPARDLSATKSFYSHAFGWTFQDYGEEYCAFNDGSLDGGFYRSDKSSSTESGAVLVVLYAQDLEKTLQTVLDGGGAVLRQIYSFPGGRRFHFADPNGNELAVWSDN
jgi:uncharacterized protein